MVELHVTQEPVSVSCVCENCGAEITVSYKNYQLLTKVNGDKLPSLHCIKCNHKNEAETMIFD